MAVNGSEQQGAGSRISVRDIVAVLFRRKWIILGVFAVTTGVTASFILSQPIYWESTGKVLVKRGARDNLLQGYTRALSWEEELASEVETARSPEVIRRANLYLNQKRKANGKDPYWIDIQRAEAAVVGESNVLAISYRDLLPEVCTEATDALLNAYTEFRHDTYALPFPKEFFEDEIRDVRKELTDLQTQRRNLLDQSGIVDIPHERVNMMQQRSQQKSTHTELKRKVIEMKTELAQMHDYLAHPEKYPDIPFATSAYVGGDVVLSNLKSELVEKKVRLAELSRIYKPGVPEIVRLEKEIEQLQALLKTEVESQIRLAELELDAQQSQLDEVEAELKRIGTRLGAMPFQEAQLAELDRQIKAKSDSYEQLVQNADRAKVNQATSRKQSVFIIAPASEPYRKNTKDYVRIALAPIFSLIVGLGLAFFVDSLDNTVRNPRDAEDSFDLPVLATLTEQNKK